MPTQKIAQGIFALKAVKPTRLLLTEFLPNTLLPSRFIPTDLLPITFCPLDFFTVFLPIEQMEKSKSRAKIKWAKIRWAKIRQAKMWREKMWWKNSASKNPACKKPVGKIPAGKNLTAKNPLGKIPADKNPVGKIPLRRIYRAELLWAKNPAGQFPKFYGLKSFSRKLNDKINYKSVFGRFGFQPNFPHVTKVFYDVMFDICTTVVLGGFPTKSALSFGNVDNHGTSGRRWRCWKVALELVKTLR